MKPVFSRNSVGKTGALWLSLWKRRQPTDAADAEVLAIPIFRWLLVTKHLNSIACLQIQWYPETHTLPSLSTAAKCGQFLERSTARSPALDLVRHSHLLFSPNNFFSGSRLGRLSARVKERWVGILGLCEATAPTDCPRLHLFYEVQEATGQPG